MTVRDVVLPMDQLTMSELRGRLLRFGAEGREQAFMVKDTLDSIENTYKRGLGRMRALVDSAFMARRAREETYLALTAEQPEVASAHRGLSIQYSNRARSAFPQLAPALPPVKAA